jgi:uncharacterized protein
MLSAMPVKELNIHNAQTFWERLGGLLVRKPLIQNEALHLMPCNSVHTFFMRYPIDVVFVDELGFVKKVVPNLKPWRIAMCKGARSVFELCAGQADHFGITTRSRLLDGKVEQ